MKSFEEVRGWRIERCRGPEGCPNRAAADDALAAAIDGAFAHRRFGELLRAQVGGPLKHRHEFHVAISDCPNACSRPQIADIGLIGAAEPGVTAEVCHQCQGCVHVCREGAVTHPGLLPIIDPALCVRCGQCARVCLSGTIQVARRGYRLQVGGKLGRHPRLATEIPGILSHAGVLAAVECCLDHYLRHAAHAERFGEVIGRTGTSNLEACVGERATRAPEIAPRPPAPILRGPV